LSVPKSQRVAKCGQVIGYPIATQNPYKLVSRNNSRQHMNANPTLNYCKLLKFIRLLALRIQF